MNTSSVKYMYKLSYLFSFKFSMFLCYFCI